MWPSATNNDMSVTYKDIDQLSQKSAVAGTEKIPVSDTQYLTPAQIATSKQVHLTDESDMPASPDASTLYLIDDDGSGGGNANIVHLEDESDMPASPDEDTLYVIDETPVAFEQTSNKVTSLSSSSTNTQYPSAKCVYDGLATKQKAITVSSSEPTSADGSDGDIWIVI